MKQQHSYLDNGTLNEENTIGWVTIAEKVY
jgi:hypothetical protein